MKLLHLTLISALLSAFISNTFAQRIEYTSPSGIRNFWSTTTWGKNVSWGSASPAGPSISSDPIINIYGETFALFDPMEIGGAVDLYIYDTLWIEGDVDLGNGAEIFAEPNSVFVVNGDMRIDGDFYLDNSSYVVVTGDLDMDNSGTISTDTTFYVYGSTTAPGITSDATLIFDGTTYNPVDGSTLRTQLDDEPALKSENFPLWSYINGSPLPLSWGKISASRSSMNSINVEWSTLEELNNDYFTIERSYDLKSWRAIGTLQGAGTSSTENAYSFTDQTFSDASKTIFYRVKQTDYDGSAQYSTVAAVSLSSSIESTSFSLKAYPNPVGETLTITSNNAEFDVTLYDMIGIQKIATHVEGTKTNLDMSSYESGAYILVVQSGVDVLRKKIVKE
jgi:hypothetical protein